MVVDVLGCVLIVAAFHGDVTSLQLPGVEKWHRIRYYLLPVYARHGKLHYFAATQAQVGG